MVELVAHDDAEIKYSTVQNWYPGNSEGKGGIYNFVTKRGDCRGANSKDLLDPGRDRLCDHLEISELHPARRQFAREFYSIAISNGFQQVDSGTKMIHLGKNTSSRIISKGIAAGRSQKHLSRPRHRASQGDGRAQTSPRATSL